MKYAIYSLILCGSLILGIGCTKDFDEINTNPNAPTSVTPSLLLPQIQRDMINAVLNEAWGIGNIVIQHTAKNQFVNEDRYLWGELNSLWNAANSNLRDLENIIKQSEASGENNILGIALVMKSWIFTLATDTYGDIPYSQATQAKNGINYPVYDAQEQIYDGILADLKKASDLLGSTAEGVGGDMIYGGNVTSWKRLANSLRIRALMRISAKRNVSAALNEIINNPSQYPVFESVDDDAEYVYLSASPDQFPQFSNRIGSFNEFRASKTLLDTLVSLNDPRLEIYFRPTPATEGTANPVYIGIPNGMDDVEALKYAGGPQNHSRIGALYYENSISPEGLGTAKGVIMTYSELQFLLAEAAEKGLISQNAETYYLQGIDAAFDFLNHLEVPANYTGQPQVTYTGSSQEKLAKIGLQKWISLFYQGMEAWFDWRRTGIPSLTPAVDNQNDNKIPVRFIYPIIEQSLNGANRQVAVSRMGGDNINTKMWILP